MDVESLLYQGRFSDLEQYCHQATIPADETYLLKARMSIEQCQFDLAHEHLSKVQNNHSNELRYLQLVCDLVRSRLTEKLLKEAKVLAEEAEKYKLAYASILFSYDQIGESKKIISSLSMKCLNSPQQVLLLHLKCLVELEEKDHLSEEFKQSLKKADAIVSQNGFWLLKPYIFFLEIKEAMAENDLTKSNYLAQFAVKMFHNPIYKKGMLPILRLQNSFTHYEEIELSNRPQLNEIFNLLLKQGSLSKEEIFAALYDEPYNPILHDSRVYMIVRRLKASLSQTHMKVSKCVNGWHLTKNNKRSHYDQKTNNNPAT